MMIKLNSFTKPFLALTLAVMLAGTIACQSQPEKTKADESKQSDQLKKLAQRLDDLEAENKELRQQVADTEDDTHMAEGEENTETATDEHEEPVAKQSGKTISFADLEDVGGKQMINDLAKVGMFKDLGKEFNPFKPVTRAEYVTWLFKANNLLKNDANKIRLAPHIEPQFSDLPSSHPAYKYAQALANAGYSVGYDDGTFKPDQPITREEMIGMKVGLDKGKNIKPDRGMMDYAWKFSDSKEVDDRFTGYIYQDYHNGGPKGTNIQRAFGKIGTFKPKQTVVRAEAAATLWQISGTNAAQVASNMEGGH